MNATMLGVPQCGDDNVQWTMTASRENAYIVYTDGTLYAVDLTTLACILTPFQPNQLGIQPDFGIAVAGSGAGESFYVYGEGSDGNPILAVSDLSSFVLTKVGDVLQEIDAATGTVLQAAQTDIITMSTWASLTGGSEVVLFVDSRVASYDLASGAQTAEADSGVSPVGAGTVLSCPGQ